MALIQRHPGNLLSNSPGSTPPVMREETEMPLEAMFTHNCCILSLIRRQLQVIFKSLQVVADCYDLCLMLFCVFSISSVWLLIDSLYKNDSSVTGNCAHHVCRPLQLDTVLNIRSRRRRHIHLMTSLSFPAPGHHLPLHWSSSTQMVLTVFQFTASWTDKEIL